jgi:hypothetical protein
MTISIFQGPTTTEWKRKASHEPRPNKAWRFKHQYIPQSFYDKIVEPGTPEEAKEKITAHHETFEDYNLQMELIDQELLMLKDPLDNLIPEYKVTEYENLMEKKHRLILGKRFHYNACNAYKQWVRSYERALNEML